MKVHVSKFRSIILKPNDAIYGVEFHVYGNSLKPASSVKLLGVHIDERLSFDDHIYTLCSKAFRQISALCLIVKDIALANGLSIYNVFNASNGSYCNTVCILAVNED